MGKNKSWATIRWNVEAWVCYDFGYQHEDHLRPDEGARPSWQVAPTIAHLLPATRHHLHQHIISTRATLRIVPLANLTHADCITFLEGPPIILGLQYHIKEEPLALASTNAMHQESTMQGSDHQGHNTNTEQVNKHDTSDKKKYLSIAPTSAYVCAW